MPALGTAKAVKKHATLSDISKCVIKEPKGYFFSKYVILKNKDASFKLIQKLLNQFNTLLFTPEDVESLFYLLLPLFKVNQNILINFFSIAIKL